MVATPTHLIGDHDTVARTQYTIPAITVTAGKPVPLVLVDGHASGTPAIPTLNSLPSGVSAAGSTHLLTQLFASSARRMTMFWLTGAGTGAIVVDVAQTAGVSVNGFLWWADEINDHDGSTPSTVAGTLASDQNTGTSAAVSLGTVADGNGCYAVVAANGAITLAAGTNYTEIATELTMPTPDVRLGAVYRANHDDVSPEMTLSSSQPWGIIAVELVTAAAAALWVPQAVVI